MTRGERSPIVGRWFSQLGQAFLNQHHQLYIVGGAVRDFLLARSIDEWDLTTDAKPGEIETTLRKIGTRQIGTIGKEFGTITAVFSGEKVEITTFRSETYDPTSRKPQTSFGLSLSDDLSRRDFTINAIAYDWRKDVLIDPHNGQKDIDDKIIRSVGAASKRFDEDPLRMLRAIRFASQLEFAIERETLEAISQEKSRLAIVSAERIAQEFDKILLSQKPSDGIELLVNTELINFVLPELIPAIDLEFDPLEHKDIYHHILQVLDNTPAKLELRWCALLHDVAKPITRQKIKGEYHFLGHENVGAKMARVVLERLRYPKDFCQYLAKLVRLHQRIPGYDGSWSDGGVRRFVRDAGETLDDLLQFAEADVTGGNERKLALYKRHRQELRERIDELEKQAEIAKIKSPLSGEDLMKLFNRPAGPWIKPIKERLLAMVLDGELQADDKDTAEREARRLVGENV